MRILLTTAFITVSIIVFGQDYNFKPQWTKGESKTLLITETEREYTNGELISDTTSFEEASVEVLKETKESYTLKILYVNVAFKSAVLLYDKLGEELSGYKNLKLIYKVNKETGESELTNWKEAQSFMNESFDKITELFDEKIPEMASLTSLLFRPLKTLFKSKETIGGYMETEVGYLLLPFHKNFKMGETITKTESQESPFDPSKELTSTTLLTLKSVDEKNHTCVIQQEVQLDLSEFIEMLKKMMMGMSQAFGTNDSIMEEKTKELDEINFEMTNLQEITFDYQSSWVTKSVITAIVSSNDPIKGSTKKETIKTVLVK